MFLVCLLFADIQRFQIHTQQLSDSLTAINISVFIQNLAKGKREQRGFINTLILNLHTNEQEENLFTFRLTNLSQ